MRNITHEEGNEPLFLTPVPPGEYSLRFIKKVFQSDGFKGAAKLLLHFEIAHGEHFGRSATRYYNVGVLRSHESGKERKRWVALRNTHLVTEFARCFGTKITAVDNIQLHSIPIDKFYGRYNVIGELEQQTKDANHDTIDPRTREPIVRKILRIDELGKTNGGVSCSSLPNSSLPFPSTPTLVDIGSSPLVAKVSSNHDYQHEVQTPSIKQQEENAAVLGVWLSEEDMNL